MTTEEDLRKQLTEAEKTIAADEAVLDAVTEALLEERARSNRWRDRFTRLKRVGAIAIVLVVLGVLGGTTAQDNPRDGFLAGPMLQTNGMLGAEGPYFKNNKDYTWKYKEKIKTEYGPIFRVCDLDRRDEYSIWIFTINDGFGGVIRVPGGMTFLKNGCR